MPIRSLWRIGVQMPLICDHVRSLIGDPLFLRIAARTQQMKLFIDVIRHSALVWYDSAMRQTSKAEQLDEQLSLSDALTSGRLEEFIQQEERRGVGPADVDELGSGPVNFH